MMNSDSPSVLIVDDEAVMVMLLQVRLRGAGMNVVGTASSKEEAVSEALETSPDYIIMDIRLTESGDGIEAAREILGKIQTRVIFISGYSEGDIKNRAMELDPLAYLVKPFDASEVISIIRE
ncbi:MAG: response regulator, partial [Fibrobacterota bacterium]